ncbi:MAG: MBL fold metallo-hydrolase [Hyphomicrobiales bacterium]|nr:MBL fold metallo-hydrolase [Hyphomicrobiales bacterium]MDE2016619.1 MBL fold metallo-hydrolase [Hyphomicrobiales bacterium]
MRVTVVGAGDAFSTGGAGQSCYRLDSGERALALDFGATALMGWKRSGWTSDELDAVAVSHLHGDHFGGLPFLLLDRQYVAARIKPLALVGPPGFVERLSHLFEVLYPGHRLRAQWRFPLAMSEIAPGERIEVAGFALHAFEMAHASGAPSLGFRVEAGGKRVAYTGDSEWCDSHPALADGADLFIVECNGGERAARGHLAWTTLAAEAGRLKARRIMATHLGAAAAARANEMRAAGFDVAADGLVVDA